MNIEWILKIDRPEVAAERLSRCFGDQLNLLEKAVFRAARGEAAAAREYLATWHGLTKGLLDLVREERPDLVVATETGELLIVDTNGVPIEVTPELLVAAAPTAPFCPWVATAGLPRGMGLRLLAAVRDTVPGSVPLIPTPGLWPAWADAQHMRVALFLIEAALAEHGSESVRTPLERAMDLFELDRTELARLFGVSRQAVEQWQRRGVPAERQAKLATIVAIGELLGRKLRPGVLPGVARTAAPTYSGRTMVDMIAADEHEALLSSVRASFDWAATA